MHKAPLSSRDFQKAALQRLNTAEFLFKNGYNLDAMSQQIANPWKRQTAETRKVEEILRKNFKEADASRYNSASIRVRVIDPRFEGKSMEERDALVEPFLNRLPEKIQADIINLLTLTPGEKATSSNGKGNAFKESLANAEFEDPSPSML